MSKDKQFLEDEIKDQKHLQEIMQRRGLWIFIVHLQEASMDMAEALRSTDKEASEEYEDFSINMQEFLDRLEETLNQRGWEDV
jgi:hypothetical protein